MIYLVGTSSLWLLVVAHLVSYRLGEIQQSRNEDILAEGVMVMSKVFLRESNFKVKTVGINQFKAINTNNHSHIYSVFISISIFLYREDHCLLQCSRLDSLHCSRFFSSEELFHNMYRIRFLYFTLLSPCSVFDIFGSLLSLLFSFFFYGHFLSLYKNK